jgi:integrase
VRRRHRDAGFADRPDTLGARLVLRGHRRAPAEAGERLRQAAPADVAVLRAMAAQTDPAAPLGLRDRLLLAFGFTMMARRSELVTVQLDDVTKVDEGLLVLIRTFKTDPDAHGVLVPVLYASAPDLCPVRLSRTWRSLLAEHGILDGPLLRSVTRHGRIGDGLSGDGARRIVRSLAVAAGVENAQLFSTHSLRAGAATAAAKNGAPVSTIAAQGRWAPNSPVVHSYIRAADAWRDHPLRVVL